MISIDQDLCFLWPSTVASIPAGWVRETALDGYFLKCINSESDTPGTPGGSNTHQHTSPVHTHTTINHIHSGYIKWADTSGGWSKDTGGGSGICHNDHNHDFLTDAIDSTNGQLYDAITYQSIDHQPPHRKFIFIKPASKVSGLPSGIIALYARSTFSADWGFCDGTGGTDDLRGRYIKGALTGENADVTTDLGSYTHIHDVGHTHTARNHGHGGTTYSANTDERGGSGGSECNTRGHTHPFGLTDYSTGGNAYVGTVTSDSVEPAYKKLLAIKNISGHTVGAMKGIIAVYIGALASIPRGWLLCNGLRGTTSMLGKHVKIATTIAELGATGGSNTHLHGLSNSHAHGDIWHNHTQSGVAQVASPSGNSGVGGEWAIQANHVHNQGTESVSYTNINWNEAMIQADESNNEPLHKLVALVQFSFATGLALQAD